jgi:hypothetical protein
MKEDSYEKVVELLQRSDRAAVEEGFVGGWSKLLLILKVPENTGGARVQIVEAQRDLPSIFAEVKKSDGRPIGFMGWGLAKSADQELERLPMVKIEDDPMVTPDWVEGFKDAVAVTFELFGEMADLAADDLVKALQLQKPSASS